MTESINHFFNFSEKPKIRLKTKTPRSLMIYQMQVVFLVLVGSP
jgi:hypothetical protein